MGLRELRKKCWPFLLAKYKWSKTENLFCECSLEIIWLKNIIKMPILTIPHRFQRIQILHFQAVTVQQNAHARCDISLVLTINVKLFCIFQPLTFVRCNNSINNTGTNQCKVLVNVKAKRIELQHTRPLYVIYQHSSTVLYTIVLFGRVNQILLAQWEMVINLQFKICETTWAYIL